MSSLLDFLSPSMRKSFPSTFSGGSVVSAKTTKRATSAVAVNELTPSPVPTTVADVNPDWASPMKLGQR